MKSHVIHLKKYSLDLSDSLIGPVEQVHMNIATQKTKWKGNKSKLNMSPHQVSKTNRFPYIIKSRSA